MMMIAIPTVPRRGARNAWHSSHDRTPIGGCDGGFNYTVREFRWPLDRVVSISLGLSPL